MAGRTLRPKRALVNIILLVATDARQRQFVVSRIVTVAASAGGLGMGAMQGKLGLVVIELHSLPGVRGMAILTLGPQRTRVHIIGLVATDAIEGKLGITCSGVAGAAFCFGVRAGQREFGFVVVKLSGFAPSVSDVAVRAITTQFAFVRVVLAMTGVAGDWCLTKFGLGGMTGRACEPDMTAG